MYEADHSLPLSSWETNQAHIRNRKSEQMLIRTSNAVHKTNFFLLANDPKGFSDILTVKIASHISSIFVNWERLPIETPTPSSGPPVESKGPGPTHPQLLSTAAKSGHWSLRVTCLSVLNVFAYRTILEKKSFVSTLMLKFSLTKFYLS